MTPLRLRQVHEAMTRPLHIGLLGAMPEEIGSDLSHLRQRSSTQHGDLTLHQGLWWLRRGRRSTFFSKPGSRSVLEGYFEDQEERSFDASVFLKESSRAGYSRMPRVF